MNFRIEHKETFANQLLAIPRERIPQVLEKVETLRRDPRPDGVTKKKLEQYKGKGNLCRLRSGDYRIIYRFGDGTVELLGVRDREDVYDFKYGTEGPMVSLPDLPDDVPTVDSRSTPAANGPARPRERQFLPTRIDDNLLTRLRIPEEYHSALRACRSDEDLVGVEAPAWVIDRVFDAVMDTDIDRVLSEPTYQTGETDDLLRFVEGDLLGFLLKLSPEQERVVDWGMRGKGPLLCEAMDSTDCFDYGRDGAIVVQSAPNMSLEYLLEEIRTVIEAREISSLQEYLAARRTGRRLPLGAKQREDIWAIYEQFGRLLDKKGVTTWERLRRHAATLIRAGAGPEKYDGVVVDEVQDLDPTVLRLLVLLCKAPNRLFITADANQSIYGSSFRWADVHEDLQLRGRVEALRINYRSTREIGEAAQAYLRNGALDDTAEERRYVVEGPQPIVREATTPDEEVRLLGRFFERSLQLYRLGRGSCAVLVPTNRTGQAIADRLQGAGIHAAWMTGEGLDLEKPCVKVMNLKSAKGLEFPIVALAGFVENASYPHQTEGEPEEREERLLRERRSMFVGMTRAMRALLVVAPSGARNPLLQGFEEVEEGLWNLGRVEATV